MPDVAFDRFYRYDELTEILQGWAQEHPELCRVESIGKSFEDRDIWLMNLERSGRISFTFDGAVDAGPVWSPDGTKIAFLSARKGKSDLYVRPSNGATTEELLLETPNDKWTQDWSRDGRYLLYREQDPETGFDLKALTMTGGERTSIAVANTRFEERYGQFSVGSSSTDQPRTPLSPQSRSS